MIDGKRRRAVIIAAGSRSHPKSEKVSRSNRGLKRNAEIERSAASLVELRIVILPPLHQPEPLFRIAPHHPFHRIRDALGVFN